jgi:hypothetical protein
MIKDSFVVSKDLEGLGMMVITQAERLVAKVPDLYFA